MRIRRLVLELTLIVLGLALAAPAAATATTLQTRITTALRAHGFAGSTSDVRVYDLSTGTGLYAHDITTKLVPASNEKLVTTATALAKWGAEYRFKTEMLTTGTLASDGTYTGMIFIKGFGDPTLSTDAYQRNVLHFTTSRVGDFVAALKKAGVKRIVGRVAGDDTYFDDLRTVGSWHADEIDDCAPLSALCLNGDLSASGGRLADPARAFAQQLTTALEKNGVPVSGKATVWPTPANAKLSYTELSAPLWRILAAMDKPSDNFMAEELTKDLGAAFGGGGTTARGLKVDRAFLVSLGIPAANFTLADGSGLSYKDRLSALDITQLLRAMMLRPDWQTFYDSLAVAGVDGTLADRMRHTPAYDNVHGKTGTLSVASNLSGFARSANGHWLLFSTLMDTAPRWIDVTAAHTAQDAIAVAVARSTPGGKVTWSPNPAPSAAPSPAATYGATQSTTP